ncbi:MAG: Rho termination factor N-terminal domain-containing protein [Elainella sp.]
MSIDFVIESVTVCSIAYFAVMFVAGLGRRSVLPVGQPAHVEAVVELSHVEGVFCCDANPEDAAIVEAFLNRPKFVDNVVPFRRPNRHPALHSLSIRELKKLASSAKIRGYSNMTKAELIERLRASTMAA